VSYKKPFSHYPASPLLTGISIYLFKHHRALNMMSSIQYVNKDYHKKISNVKKKSSAVFSDVLPLS
jgi:hypothetical protein